jgi:hypothetical protein
MEASKSILRSANQTLRTSDLRGRSLAFRRPTALDTLRLFKAAGPVLAQNSPWLSMASLAFAVEEIDGVPVPAPVNELQIELLVDRLGEDGLSAIAKFLEITNQDPSLEDQAGN